MVIPKVPFAGMGGCAQFDSVQHIDPANWQSRLGKPDQPVRLIVSLLIRWYGWSWVGVLVLSFFFPVFLGRSCAWGYQFSPSARWHKTAWHFLHYSEFGQRRALSAWIGLVVWYLQYHDDIGRTLPRECFCYPRCLSTCSNPNNMQHVLHPPCYWSSPEPASP